MANTNPQAVTFANGKIRPHADLLARCYYACKQIVNAWNGQNVSAVIPNDSTLIADGSASDGRAQITNAQATAIITRATDFVTDYEATNNAKLNTVLAVSPNPTGGG